MNTERILAVADKIESLPTVDPREHTETPAAARTPSFSMRFGNYGCGSPACIAGWAVAMFGGSGEGYVIDRAASVLGLDDETARGLFVPRYGLAHHNQISTHARDFITAARAAAVLRLVAAEVDVESAWAQTAPEAGTPDTPDTPETVVDAWAMRCPACGKDDTLVINATVSVRLRPDGTDDENSGGHEWDDDSPCTCGAVDGCGFSGKVRAFNIPVQTFTAFCQSDDHVGTIWIDCVHANDPATAALLAVEKCAGDWEYDPANVECIGLAEGDVTIVAWDDEQCLTKRKPWHR